MYPVCLLEIIPSKRRRTVMTKWNKPSRSPLMEPSKSQWNISVHLNVRYKRPVLSGKKKNPGGEVIEFILWKGPSVKRPVSNSVTLQLDGILEGKKKVTFQPDENDILVSQSEFTQSILPNDSTYGPPKTGDHVAGLWDCMIKPNDQPLAENNSSRAPENVQNSRRLRIWDELTAREKLEAPSNLYESRIEFDRNGKRFYYMLRKSNYSSRGEILATKTTDAAGLCRFENLPAGTYYVQARAGNLQSPVTVLHPACGGANLLLFENGVVHVTVKKSGINIRQLAAIQDVNLTLQSTDGQNVLFMSETDEEGRASFKNTPFGQYKLQVTPPAESGYPTKTLTFTLEDQKHLIDVEYDVDEAYTISGHVIRTDTREPVPGFHLNLFRNSRSFGEYGDYGTVQSARRW